jgi:hypothetical protein
MALWPVTIAGHATEVDMRMHGWCGVLLVAGIVQATEVGQVPAARPANTNQVDRLFQTRSQQHKDNPDVRVRRGLVADRKVRKVTIDAEATGLSPKGNPPEFFLVAENSGHAYEALLVSFAKAGDVQEALEFIGMKPGRPVDFTAFRFWPKGERVLASVMAPGPDGTPRRMETLLAQESTRLPLPLTGLVFTGSPLIPDEAGGTAHAADLREPNSIAASYNEPSSVLDVPRSAPQAQVYNTVGVNPDTVYPEGQLLSVTLEPEYRDGRLRVLDLHLTATAKEGTAGTNLENVVCQLTGPDGQARTPKPVPLDKVVPIFATDCQNGQDPFVTVTFDPGLALRAVRDACAVLLAMEQDQGIRLEPPAEGQLFCKAFTPNEAFRDRSARQVQPWELHFTATPEGKTKAVLTQIEETYPEGSRTATLKVTDFPVADGSALRAKLDERGPGLPVVLVFAPSSLPYGRLMEFLVPVLKTHPIIHVYLEPAGEKP